MVTYYSQIILDKDFNVNLAILDNYLNFKRISNENTKTILDHVVVWEKNKNEESSRLHNDVDMPIIIWY